MHVRLPRRSDLPITTELVRQLGYNVQPSDVAERIDLIVANDSHYAAVADDGDTILGLVHAYTRPALERALTVVVQSLPSAEIWDWQSTDGGRRDLGSL